MGQSEETEGAEFTPEQAKIVETLRDMQSEIADVKAELMAKLSESRQECDSLYRELSKVRDELITSKTERRVLSRWYEDVKTERDKLHGELVDVRSALAAATEERDSLRITLDAWEQADTKPHKRVAVTDVADHVVPPVLKLCKICHGCGSTLVPNDESRSLWHCRNNLCARRNTGWDSPFEGPCKSATLVRHE